MPFYLYQGIPFNVDFSNANELVSYTGTRNIQKSGIQQINAIKGIWKFYSPLQALDFCLYDRESPLYYDSGQNICKACPINCTLCQSSTKCLSCEHPYLIGNSELCQLKKFISPQSGVAQFTIFKLNGNYTQLANNNEGMTFKQIRIIYPDLSVRTVNQTSFIIPNYSQKSYEVKIIVSLILGGRQHQLPQEKISMTSAEEASEAQVDQMIDEINPKDKKSSAQIKEIQKSATDHQSDNQCGCVNGECVNRVCECGDKYEGSKCQYTKAQFSKLRGLKLEIAKSLENIAQDQKLEVIHNLSQSYETMKHETANITMRQLQGLSSQINSRINNATLDKYINSVNSALQALTTQTEVQKLIRSELQFSYQRYKNISSNVIASRENKDSEFQNKLGKLVHTYYHSLNNSQSNALKFGDNTLSLPPSVNLPPNSSLFVFQVFLDLYEVQANKTKVGPTIDVQIFNKDQVINLQNTDIELKIKLDSQTIAMAQRQDKKLQFLNWNGTNWSNEGATVIEINQNQVKVKTNSPSKLSLFFQQGLNVLKDSNYNLFPALKNMSLQDLLANAGFYLAIAFWLLYFILILAITIVQKIKFKGSLLEKLKSELQSQNMYKIQSTKNNQDGKISEQQPDSSRKLKKIAWQVQSFRQKQKSRSKQSIMGLKAQKKQQIRTNPSSIQDIQAVSPRNIKSKQSRWRKITVRLQSNLKDRSRNCCKRFSGSVIGEISQNNLPFNIVAKQSVLESRKMRLSLLFLGLISDIAANALFFDLDAQGDEEGSFFEDFNQNFWIAVYSAFITMIFLFLLGMLISFPQSYKKKIESQITSNSQESSKKIQKLFRKFKISRIFAYIFFFLVTCFLQIYLIAFCEAASQKSTNQWLSSSFLTFLIDMILFELIASIIVSAIVLIKVSFKCCKWIIILALLIEVYRAYKNLSSD